MLGNLPRVLRHAGGRHQQARRRHNGRRRSGTHRHAPPWYLPFALTVMQYNGLRAVASRDAWLGITPETLPPRRNTREANSETGTIR
jgi:hypothetical protein